MGEEKTVSYPYLRNMVGMSVDEESMMVVPHAQAELYTHVVTKFAQLGAIVGAITAGAYAAIKRQKPISRSVLAGTRNGMIIGLPLGVWATYGRMRGLQKADEDTDMEYAYFDRSYRLRHNRNQVRVDRMAYVGLAGGALAGAAVNTGVGVLSSSAAGFATATVLAGFYNMTLAKRLQD